MGSVKKTRPSHEPECRHVKDLCETSFISTFWYILPLLPYDRRSWAVESWKMGSLKSRWPCCFVLKGHTPWQTIFFWGNYIYTDMYTVFYPIFRQEQQCSWHLFWVLDFQTHLDICCYVIQVGTVSDQFLVWSNIDHTATVGSQRSRCKEKKRPQKDDVLKQKQH